MTQRPVIHYPREIVVYWDGNEITCSVYSWLRIYPNRSSWASDLDASGYFEVEYGIREWRTPDGVHLSYQDWNKLDLKGLEYKIAEEIENEC